MVSEACALAAAKTLKLCASAPAPNEFVKLQKPLEKYQQRYPKSEVTFGAWWLHAYPGPSVEKDARDLLCCLVALHCATHRIKAVEPRFANSCSTRPDKRPPTLFLTRSVVEALRGSAQARGASDESIMDQFEAEHHYLVQFYATSKAMRESFPAYPAHWNLLELDGFPVPCEVARASKDKVSVAKAETDIAALFSRWGVQNTDEALLFDLNVAKRLQGLRRMVDYMVDQHGGVVQALEKATNPVERGLVICRG